MRTEKRRRSGREQSNPRRSARLVNALAIAATFLVGVVPSVGATGAAPARSLAVSVPAEPIQVVKGVTARIPIRVVNPGNQSVTVTISPRLVLLGDNGRVTIGSSAAPDWQGRVRFDPPGATIGSHQYVDVDVAVDVPAAISADLHFVGFLVSPVAEATGGQLTVINQIGSFVTIDVPGPRSGALTATLRFPSISLGRHATGTLLVSNVGQSSVRFWGESDTTSWPAGSSIEQQRFDKSLSPGGVKRTLSVSARPAWLIGFVTIRGQIIYSATVGSETTEIEFSTRVLVVDPRLIVGLALVALLAIVGWWRHRRRAQNGSNRTSNALTD
jgi:hypothetical protein